MSNSPRISKYRWTTGAACKNSDELAVEPTAALWDCGNLLACNDKYVAVPWSSVGCTAIIPHAKATTRGFKPHKLVGHKGHVIDLQFSPFNSNVIATGSEDATVKAWRIPDEGMTADIKEPTATLTGHTRKVGLLQFHPSAENVLATAGMDHITHIYDITAEAPKCTFKPHGDQILSLNWNIDGSLLNMTAKDKSVHVMDSRTGAIAMSGKSHEGAKTQRSLWCKRRNQIVTMGFNRSQYRQMMLFDARNVAKPLYVHELDQMSNIMIPFFDEDTNMLYIGGRGEAGIKYFEIWDEAVPFCPLNGFQAGDPIKGLAAMPKSSMRVKDCELMRFYKLTTQKLLSISFTLPRRQGANQFQSDIYPTTFSSTPSITAADFFAGKNAVPGEIDLAPLFDGGVAAVATSGALSTPSTPVREKKPGDLTEKDVADQQKKVEDAEATLKAEQAKLEEMRKKLAAQQAEEKKAAADAAADKPAAAAAAAPAAEEKKTEAAAAAVPAAEEKKPEEAAAAPAAEEKKPEEAAAAASEEKKE